MIPTLTTGVSLSSMQFAPCLCDPYQVIRKILLKFKQDNKLRIISRYAQKY